MSCPSASKKAKPKPPPKVPVKANAQRLKPKTDVHSLPNSQQHLTQNNDPLRFVSHYPAHIVTQVELLIQQHRLAKQLLQRYPTIHDIRSDKALYDYAIAFKQTYLRQSDPLTKVVFDDKINLSHHALGLHSYVNRRQGNKVKAKNEIRISSRLRRIPEPLLRMVVVHELAHLKEKDHNKAFYQLCCVMEPQYHQLEFDMRLLLISEALGVSPYQ